MTEACCQLNASGVYECHDMDRCECLKLGGIPGGASTTCDDYCQFAGPTFWQCPDCNTGACCKYDIFDGSFIRCSQVGANGIATCRSTNGIFYGIGTHCTKIPCSQGRWIDRGPSAQGNNPVGACCCVQEIPGGIQTLSCTTTTKSQCGLFTNPCQGESFPHFQGPNENDVIGNYWNLSTTCEVNGCDLRPTTHSPHACCQADGLCLNLSTDDCCRNSGAPQDGVLCENHQCEGFVDVNCRKVEPDALPEGRLTWGADLCGQTAFEIYTRTPEEYPSPDNDPTWEGAGWFEALSAYPIRGKGLTANQHNALDEPCAYHFAHFVIHNGWLRLFYCTNPTLSPDDVSWNFADFAIVEHDEDGHLQDWSGVWVGSYESLPHVEVQYHSTPITCFGPFL